MEKPYGDFGLSGLTKALHDPWRPGEQRPRDVLLRTVDEAETSSPRSPGRFRKGARS